jgi:heptosyltransferase-1
VLLVKMSSLGDVVHALVPVTDAQRAIPGLEVDWVIEEAYQSLPGWHSNVRRVIPVALRRWRRSPWSMIRDNEWFRFRADLRKDSYDLVLDAQGLLKSAWIGTQARGPLVGRSRSSAREPLATAFYKKRFEIDLSLSEVEQLRQLFAFALGYPQPKTPADFGITPERPFGESTNRYAVLIHGAAWQNKLWPVADWQGLGHALVARGLKVFLPWGTDEEKCRAEQIASTSGGVVLPKFGISDVMGVLAGARVVVGLDTGLTHIAIAMGTPTITLYGPSVPVYGEIAGGKVIHLTSTDSREVNTRRKNTVPLSEVLEAIERLVDR